MHKSASVSIRAVRVCVTLGELLVEMAEMISVTTPTAWMLLEGGICWLLKRPSVMRTVSVTISVHSTAISTEICAGNLLIPTSKVLLLMPMTRESVEVTMLSNIGVWVKSAVRAALMVINIMLVARVERRMQVTLRGSCDLSRGMVRLSHAALAVGIALLLIERFGFGLRRLGRKLRFEGCSPGLDVSTKLFDSLLQLFERWTHILELKYRRARMGLRSAVGVFFDTEFDAINNFELIRDSVMEIGRFDNTGKLGVVADKIKGHWDKIE
jgi:hypothetical protein